MNQISIKLGFWSAVFCAALFIIFTFCFVGILLTSPLFLWTSYQDYIDYVNKNSQFLAHLARLSMVLFGPLFVILLNAIHDCTPNNKKILTRISIGFGLGFAILSGLFYFMQITAVRLNLLHNQPEELLQFVQANPYGALLAVNMLGVTLYLGLASIFAAPVFGNGRLENIIKYALLLNGIFCLTGGIAYALELTTLLFLTINLGMGAAVLVATISLAVWFRRLNLEN